MLQLIARSVRGPAHIKEGLPCQDAWWAHRGESGAIAVVCDGLGSKIHSREGARVATQAARAAWRLWRKGREASPEEFVRLLEVIWRLKLSERAHISSLNEAATTCLVYAEDLTGRALLAQLGDGLIMRRLRDGRCEPLKNAQTLDFNQTYALGTPHSLQEWSLHITNALQEGEALLMATDGVSEDLEQGRHGALIEWITQELSLEPNPSAALARELKAWPVPHHRDDKTLLVMWRERESQEERS